MIGPQHCHHEPYSFKNLILPPLYLFDKSEVIVSKELVEKEPVACASSGGEPVVSSEIVVSSDETVCSVWESSRTIDRKTVAFQTDKDGKVQVTEYAGLEELTAEECAAAWYRSSELKYFRKYGKKLATIAAASKYGKDFLKTCRACEKGEKDLDKYSKIANSGARGLEVLVAPQLVKDRKGAIRSVLKAQSKSVAEGMSADQRVEVLSATSRILSRQTKVLAGLLARGDANIAMDLHEKSTFDE